ncbi:hypothetical protein Q5752_004829 [Cryptotrichosporon argae]
MADSRLPRAKSAASLRLTHAPSSAGLGKAYRFGAPSLSKPAVRAAPSASASLPMHTTTTTLAAVPPRAPGYAQRTLGPVVKYGPSTSPSARPPRLAHSRSVAVLGRAAKPLGAARIVSGSSGVVDAGAGAGSAIGAATTITKSIGNSTASGPPAGPALQPASSPLRSSAALARPAGAYTIRHPAALRVSASNTPASTPSLTPMPAPLALPARARPTVRQVAATQPAPPAGPAARQPSGIQRKASAAVLSAHAHDRPVRRIASSVSLLSSPTRRPAAALTLPVSSLQVSRAPAPPSVPSEQTGGREDDHALVMSATAGPGLTRTAPIAARRTTPSRESHAAHTPHGPPVPTPLRRHPTVDTPHFPRVPRAPSARYPGIRESLITLTDELSFASLSTPSAPSPSCAAETLEGSPAHATAASAGEMTDGARARLDAGRNANHVRALEARLATALADVERLQAVVERVERARGRAEAEIDARARADEARAWAEVVAACEGALQEEQGVKSLIEAMRAGI